MKESAVFTVLDGRSKEPASTLVSRLDLVGVVFLALCLQASDFATVARYLMEDVPPFYKSRVDEGTLVHYSILSQYFGSKRRRDWLSSCTRAWKAETKMNI